MTSRTVGIVTSWVGTAYWASIMNGALDALREAGARAMVFCLGYTDGGRVDARVPFFRLAGERSSDGFVVLAPASFSDGVENFLAQRGRLPIVTVGQRFKGYPGVLINNADGIASMMDHLVSRCGHRRIAFIRGPIGNGEAEARYRAYEDFCYVRSLGFHGELVEAGDFSEASGERAAERLLDTLDPLPDAIFASNDLMALGALTVVKERGLRVPKDVAVVGFDDLEAPHADPPLTTIRQPVYDIGRRAAELVLKSAAGEAIPEVNLYAPRLIVRESCGFGSREDTEYGRRKHDSKVEVVTDSLVPPLSVPARNVALSRIEEAADKARAVSELYGVLNATLPALGVDALYFVRLQGDTPGAGQIAQIDYGFANGRALDRAALGSPFDAASILPAELGRPSEPSTRVVLPVGPTKLPLGYIVAEGDVIDIRAQERLARALAQAAQR